MPRSLLTMLLLAACDGGYSDTSREFGSAVPEDAPLHAVRIHQPKTLGVADTPLEDVNGTPIGVGCATCHGATPERSWVPDLGDTAEFHTRVDLVHGDLTCEACHDREDRTKLHLADGRLLEMDEAMTLCAQCHGLQHRDYQRGSHGGMNGYWDLRRGSRTRNHCVDCHAPHQPAYEAVLPVHPPRDRYLAPTTHGEDH